MSECESCGRTVTDGAPLCVPEADGLATALRDVPALLQDLEVTRTRQDKLTHSGPSRSGDSPVPWKEQVPEPVWVLGNTITTWARDLADRRHLTLDTGHLARHPRRDWSDPIGPLRPLPPDPVESIRYAATWLAGHVRELRTLDDALQAHDEISDAIAHARRVIDRPADMRFVGPCGYELGGYDEHGDLLLCKRDLYVAPGAITAACPDGHPEVEVTERREWLLDVVHDRLATYTEASRALSFLVGYPLPASTVRTWVSRHQLEVKGYVHRRVGADPVVVGERQTPIDQPMVRVGDVLALMASGGRGQASETTS